MKEICKLYKNIFSIILIIIIILFIPITVGYSPYSIETGSMEPNISKGSLIYIIDVQEVALKINDIITFKKGSQIVTHRIVGIDSIHHEFTTKGDAIKYNDTDKVSIQNMKGKVEYSIPLIGYLVMFFQSIEGMILGSVLVMFYIYSLYISGKYEGRQ